MTLDLSNIRAIARREYVTRARTRAFRLTTGLLVVVALGIALAPILIRWIDRSNGPTAIEVYVGDSKPAVDIPGQLQVLLNTDPLAAATGNPGATPTTAPKYRVTTITDLDAARGRVAADTTGGLLVVSRNATTQDLEFSFVTQASQSSVVAQIIHQGAASIAIQDRLAAAGISPPDQAKLFAPPTYAIVAAKPSSDGTTLPTNPAEALVSGQLVGFVLSIILFMAIILYGQWVAYSVAEEKSSRVMEVILGAASPFELLSGKVVGVGALAITQYAVIFVPAAIAVVFQDQIASAILGGPAASASIPTGLSIPVLLAFGAFFVLGFALYAVLYAGAAALVSRTEDINQIIAPMTLLSTAGYLAAVWSSTGVIRSDSPLLTVMSFIPFFSPYLMLSRYGAGAASAPEVLIALVLLALTIPAALWVAARLYAAGVLLYGQRPSIRLLARALRGS